MFESNSPAPEHPPLYEERIILLRATSDADAIERAKQYADSEQFSYQNAYGETITVTSKRLLEVTCSLYEPAALEQGTEVYSRHFRDYAVYESFEPLLKGQAL